jgi:polyisoprenoid-binding protein YceI
MLSEVERSTTLLHEAAMTSTATLPTSTSTTWQIDPAHSLVEFSVRHMMVSTVKGRFTGISGTITAHAVDHQLSSADITIDASSIVTGDPNRDAHLRSADFLDAEQFPNITFVSKRIEGARDEFTLIGDLSLHGVTREVRLDVTFNGEGTNPYGKRVAGFSAEAKLNRKDWGLNWNVALEAGGVLVSDQLKVSIEIQAIKAEASA